MCGTCGCSDNNFKIYKPSHDNGNLDINKHHHSHLHNNHQHQQGHIHNFTLQHSNTISVEKNILHANDLLAERNKGYFEAKNICAFNIVSSPGSGKTSILERTLNELMKTKLCYVIEGDQQTDNDAKRILATGTQVVQINTGNACHLDAHMIHHAIHDLAICENALLFIENVGNLVCPALFDLGETYRITIFSVTEGEDKPLKYPNMFFSSHVVVLNKIDLLPYLDFNLEMAIENTKKINPTCKIFKLSAKTSEGFDEWLSWLSSL